MVQGINQGKGWANSWRQGMHEMQKEKQQEGERAAYVRIAELPTFGFDDMERDLHKAMEEMDEGNMTFIQRNLAMPFDRLRGGAQSAMLEERRAQTTQELRIIGELTPHERRQPKLLDWRARRAIAAKLDLPLAEIEKFFLNFMINHAMWTFLRREHLRGRPLPTNNDEFQWMIAKRPTREYVAVMKAYVDKKERLEEERNDVPERERRHTKPSKIL